MTPSNPFGILIGRFMPPHTGHQYLVRFARAFTGNVVIFVCTLPKDPIPGDLRYSWMQELFPFARVVHITEEIPQAARGEKDAHRIWAQAIRRHLTGDPDYVFASESYGAEFAAALGSTFVPVDPGRAAVPVSAGAIRKDPFGHWNHLPEIVRPYFALKVAVGEPLLAGQLATHFKTVTSGEYIDYAHSIMKQPPEDPAFLLKAQRSVESALMQRANRVLFTCPDASLMTPADRGGGAVMPHLAIVGHREDQGIASRCDTLGIPVQEVGDGSDALKRAIAAVEHALETRW